MITVASWEPRFIEGFEWSLKRYSPSNVRMYYLDHYADWTADHRQNARRLCEARHVVLAETELCVDDPPGIWETLRDTVSAIEQPCGESIVHVTTMPRDVVWSLFWLLEWRGIAAEYVYHRPLAYDKGWLSRDPERPRLVYKLSGLSRLGAKTTLVVLAGYDPERAEQLMQVFEPEVTLIGLQTVEADGQNDDRMALYRKRFRGMPDVHMFELNAYANDHGEAVIETNITEYLQSNNIIMSSLGPKLSAIALYRIQKKHPEIALAYAPSREFNQNYSRGMGAVYRGVL